MPKGAKKEDNIIFIEIEPFYELCKRHSYASLKQQKEMRQ